MPRTDRENVSRYWWDRHTSGLSLMCADFRTKEYPPHTHEAFVVAVTENGGSVIKSRGVVEEADASALFVFNPAEPHSGWMGWSRRWRYRSLYLTRSAIDAVARGLGIVRIPYFTRNKFSDPDLIDSFAALHRSLEQDGDALHGQELLLSSFGCLFVRHGSGGGRIEPAPHDRVLLDRVKHLMNARYAEPLPLDVLGAAAGLTPYQLIELCKRGIGMTPHAYLTQVRLNRACHHLRLGVPIAEAATACGFYDQSALNRHFKRCYGITPRQFARAAAEVRRSGRPSRT